MEKGITQQRAQELLIKHGKNIISSESTFSILGSFISQFTTVINAILFVAAIFSFFIHNSLDAALILSIIFINSILGFIQEFKAEKSLEKLKNMTAPTARVIRDGKEQEILASDLVPSDIVVLSEGARVPADGQLLEATHLEIDESILTGESLAAIKKHKEDASLGTFVTKGNGLMLVTATGNNTQFGQIAKTLSSIENEKTPLQKNLSQMAKFLSFGAIIIGLLIIPIGALFHENIFDLILVAISIGVAAIPEGLPAVITIAFAIGANRMAKQKAIVRKMAAIETLGAIQVALSDKTGTITRNQMSVKTFYIPKRSSLPLLVQSCVLGNTASLAEKGNEQNEIIGDQTDGALLLWAKKQKVKFVLPKAEVLDEYVFDSMSKLITTVWKKNNKKHVFVRGAPEEIIYRCVMSKKDKIDLTKKYEEFAKSGLRVIAFATKISHHKGTKPRKELEKSLNFLGFIGIYDPPRPEIKQAIANAKSAGIHVCMVTGDNPLTALSIAKEIGLIEKDEDVLTGDDLTNLSDEKLSEIILKTRVFARTKPAQKLRITTLLQNKGMVVGVTGDGVNDALALKKADVGISMGEGGTDVAREASDIVLSDNNFATLIKAIEEGRVIYKNVTNSIVYLISGNLAEISVVFFAVLFHLPFPLLPTQILWINLVTDSLPAIALASGNRDSTVLRNKPRDPNDPILNKKRLAQILLIGFSLSGILLTVFYFILPHMSEIKARTIIFNGLIYLHLLIIIFLGWNSIKHGNKFLIFTIILIAVLQAVITFVPFFQNIFHLAL